MKKLCFALVLCLGCAALLVVDWLQLAHFREKSRVELESVSNLVRIRLKDAVEVRFSAIEALAALFIIHPETTGAEFGSFADTLLNSNPPIRALQFADENTRVIYSYPPKGNEITIEKPMLLLGDPKRGPFTAKAIRSKAAVLQGPFPLRQGGVGAVVRLPVFRHGAFIGLAIGVFDVPVLIKEAFAGLELHSFLFQVADDKGKVFWGDDSLPQGALSRRVPVADINWTVAVGWNPTAHAPPLLSRLVAWGFGGAFLTALLIVGRQSWRQEQALRNAVEERTRELKRRERRYGLLFNSGNDAVFVHRVGDGGSETFTEVNDIACFLLGYARDELLEMRPSFIEAPGMKDVRGRAKAELERTGRCVFEAAYMSRAGARIPVEISSRMFESEEEQFVLSTARDITERKQADARLKQSERRYRVLFEKSPLGMVYLDENGVVVDCNDNMLRLTGSARGDLAGRSAADVLEVPGLDAVIRKSLGGQPGAVEGEYASGNGGQGMSLRVMCNPVNPETPSTPLIVAVEDITERTRMEEAQRRAREAAEEANRSKSEFLANMSHEIRTPLNGISGMLQVLQVTGLESEQAEVVDKALFSARRLARLLSDILDLSRVEAGKLELRPEAFDFNDVMDSLWHLLHPAAQQKGLILRLKVDSGVPKRLVGDSTRIQQVLVNVVGNAIKFTVAGYVDVAVEYLSGREPDQCRLLFSISDTGTGMSELNRARLFMPFVQGAEGYTRLFQGAGLGLAITKRLVETMGGSIDVDSEEGRGTAFHICLPLGVAAQPATPERPAQDIHAERGCKVLLAEDDDVTRYATAKSLEQFGYHVKAVKDGMEALSSLKKEPFNIVVMDIQMPFMDGVQATRAIRRGEAGERHADIPIVAITAYAMVGDRERFLEEGMDSYLPKPLEMKDLHAALRRSLQKMKGVSLEVTHREQ